MDDKATTRVPIPIRDNAPLDRDRPYTDQQPKRDQHLVAGLTMRDIHDCMVRGFLLSAAHVNSEGYRKAEENTCCHNDLYGWDTGEVSPGAAIRNGICEIEKMMEIYPNLLDFEKTERECPPESPTRS